MTLAIDRGRRRHRVAERDAGRYALASGRRAAHRLRHLLAREQITLTVLVLVAGTLHAVGMSTYPNWLDDPGTYLSQAWAVQNLHALSPYSYFYDHAPLGWIQIAAWSMLTNGFGRHSTAIDFGNECMLIAKLVSVVLLYLLCRRIRMDATTSTAAAVAFAASPLVIHYTRLTYLDNLVTPWLLLAFYLAADPRRHLMSVAGATSAFACAALTKETTLITLPALLLALWQNSDRRTRDKAWAVAGLGASLMVLYPVYALVKGELLLGEGHNSLLGTAVWQLQERTPSGSVLDASSATHALWLDWLRYDHVLLIAGTATAVAALFSRRLRPYSVLLACFGSTLFTGGYVPFMHVINFLPWLTIVLFGTLDHLLAAASHNRPHWFGTAAAAVTMGALLALVAPAWIIRDHAMMTVDTPPPLKQASTWIQHNVPRNRVLVVHDALWTDLVAKDAFPRGNVIIVYKVDSDPAVNRALRRIDYLVLPDYYYQTASAAAQYPTALAAKDRAVAVARFGTDPMSSVTVYRVSRVWSPRTGTSTGTGTGTG